MSAAQIKRCGWCVKYDLPCGDLTHDNVLARYVPLMSTTNLSVSQITDTIPVTPGEPVVRMSHPTEHYERARRRADRLSAVAILVLAMVAAIVTVGLFLAATYFDPAPAGRPGTGWTIPIEPHPTPNPEVTP